MRPRLRYLSPVRPTKTIPTDPPGKRLRLLLFDRCITQLEAARQLRCCRATLWRIIAGKPCSAPLALEIARWSRWKVSAEELIRGWPPRREYQPRTYRRRSTE